MNLVLALPDDRFLPLFGAAAVLCSLLGFWVRSRFLSPRDPPQEQHLDLQPMPLAYLAGGARRMRCVGVALLWRRGAIAFNGENKTAWLVQRPTEALEPVEEAVLRQVRVSSWRALDLLDFGSVPTQAAVQELARRGLVVPPGRAVLSRVLGAAPLAVVVWAGVEKFWMQTSRNQPSGYLFVALVVFVGLLCNLAFMGSRVTPRGQAALHLLLGRHHGLRKSLRRTPRAKLVANELALAVALFDTDVLGDDAHDLKSALTLPTQPFLTITTESQGFEDDDS